MSGGTQQLRLFRRAIRDGLSLEEAVAATRDPTFSLSEAKYWSEHDQKNPPPPEAFELLYDPEARAAASNPEESAMATAAKEKPQNGGEYKRPDAAKAFEIYDKQIKPKLAKIDTARGECSQPWADIKEMANFPRPVMNFLLSLENIDDDAKRDHYLLALADGLKLRKLFLPSDLVTQAQGNAGGEVVPMGERKKPQLATLPMGVPSDGSETDLGDVGEEIAGDGSGEALPDADDNSEERVTDGFTEATEEELQQQTGRGKKASVSSMAPAETVQ